MKRFFWLAALLLIAFACNRELPVNEPIEVIEPDPVPAATVIHARFEDPATKSRLQLNSEGTAAKVLWTQGDAIKVLGIQSTGGYYFKTFSTQDDGVTAADFSCKGWNPDPSATFTGYVGFYPDDKFSGYINEEYGSLGVWIPSVQKATAGGIEEGLNLSYATATDMSEDLVFRNVPALLKFRLSGDIVSSLASIKFVSRSVVAGDILLSGLDKPEPTYFVNNFVNTCREESGNVIELRGTFQAGVDYYMAMIPGETDGFSMIFLDNSGQYVIKESSKELTLSRSRIVDFGTINVGNTFGDPAVRQYMKSTKSKPVDLVVLPDGFTEMQRENYETLAQSGIDFLFNTEPYRSYKDYFNVYFMWKPSAETGASVSDGKGNITQKHNTAFGSFWGEDSYDDMAADADAIFSFVSSHCPEIVLGDKSIDEVPVLMIVNDERYGGRAITYSSGRTYCIVPYTYAGGTLNWSYPAQSPDRDEPYDSSFDNHVRNTTDDEKAALGINSGDWRNTLLHEFGGHSFGRLADEYWYSRYLTTQASIAGHSYPVPFGLNVSGYYDNVPWQTLLDKDNNSALVSRDSRYGRIGKFQGANVYLFNSWRSEKISCMIDNRTYFSTWQRYLIVQRILNLAGESSSLTLDSFLAKDDPTDPLRDGATPTSVTTKSFGPVRIMPPLAPPELIDNTTRR